MSVPSRAALQGIARSAPKTSDRRCLASDRSEDFEVARNNVAALFTTAKIIRPKSVRQESYEIYLVGLNRK